MKDNIFFNNRSFRTFTDKKISKEDLNTMIENARYSASARNAQNIRYALISSDEICDEIFPLTAWAGAIEWNPNKEEAPTAYIILCLPNDKNLNYNMNYFDMGLAAQNILLTANSLGYGGCILASFNKIKTKELLNLPENYNCEIMIALGEPNEKASIIDAKDGNTKYHRDVENRHNYVPKILIQDLIIKNI